MTPLFCFASAKVDVSFDCANKSDRKIKNIFHVKNNPFIFLLIINYLVYICSIRRILVLYFVTKNVLLRTLLHV